MLSGLDDVEGGETDEDSGDHERQAEECGGAAVDGGGALGGVVWESGRQAGAAAEYALFDGCGGFGGESDRHGTCLRPECLWQWGSAIGLCERGTMSEMVTDGVEVWNLHMRMCNNMCEVIYGYQPSD